MLRTAGTLFAVRPAAGLPYRVEVQEGRAAFDALRDEWNAVVARGPADLPFARHEWIAAWLDAFAPEGRLRVLAARDAAGRPPGSRRSSRSGPGGRPPRRAGERPLLPRRVGARAGRAGRGGGALGAPARRLRWDVLLLRDLPRDGPTSTLLEPLARADRHLTGRWESLRTPYIALGGEGAEARTSSRFRANLRRRARRLGEQGAVAVRREDGTGDLSGALGDFLALERSGWKGARGTAIAGDPRLVAFYARVAHDAAARGALAIRALALDGHPVAIHLGLVHRGVYYLPKTAYDERLGAVSPGQLLHREVVAECEARGLSELDFLGPDMEWKRDWEPRHRPHDWLYVYRPSLAGRAMHTLRHRVRPVVKEVLGWRP